MRLRIRPQGEEADEDTDQSASLDPEEQDKEWALQGREVHGVANEQQSDGAPRTDVPDTGAKRGGKCEKAQKANENALEKETVAEEEPLLLSCLLLFFGHKQ